ncbi:GNAT family N-acetyltransferase [Chengkuizengella sediminis]|uniref:GNAT family N-acetyltransferase n=1 Tax=Chengkuizengella sediminis TaxID=1885917 RepID=UPI0013894935|nr:GNAT family N-acetyltransferase [Chengkuizengella sediminis]NDI36258.1 GNAT family N-acetyltransferase [Chengkuizengella sediminis]
MLIRKATQLDTEGIAKVHVESWKTTYKGIISDDYLNNRSVEFYKTRWNEFLMYKNQFVYVAETKKGEIIGFSNGGRERDNHSKYKGELYAIYILKSYQRKGIGKLLVKPILNDLNKMNINTMLIWVLKENKSRYFYEKLGGRVVGEKPIAISGKVLDEIGYGFEDIHKVLKKLKKL